MMSTECVVNIGKFYYNKEKNGKNSWNIIHGLGRSNKTLILTDLESGSSEVQVQEAVVSGEHPHPTPSFPHHLTWGQSVGRFPSPAV